MFPSCVPFRRAVLFFLVLALCPLLAPASYFPGRMKLVNAFPNLTFSAPLELQEAPDGSGRLFVIERAGLVKVFPKSGNPTSASVYMDIRDRVSTSRDQALMSIAFDPDFATNGRFYLHYSWNGTDAATTHISRFTAATPGAATCDPATEEVLLSQYQPFRDHNGGTIAFGPDGMLYIALGDGGSITGELPAEWNGIYTPIPSTDPASQDVFGNGQNTKVLLGKILRIDVRATPDPGLNYRIPPDNPFFSSGPDGTETRKEIYAYGLRNPWRMAFDPLSGRLIAADVGAKTREEIDHIKPGANYGWSRMEGDICFRPTTGCDPALYESPIVSLVWATANITSITGGYFYTSPANPALHGAYIFADWAKGRFWAMQYDGTTADYVEIIPATNNLIAGFGRDLDGEVYALNFSAGTISVLRPDEAFPSPTPSVTPTPSPTESATPTASLTEAPTASLTPTPTESLTPTATDSHTPPPTDSLTPTPTESLTPTATVSPTPSPTESLTPSPTQSLTPPPTDSLTPTPTESLTPTATESPSPSPTDSLTPTPTESLTPTPTESPSPSPAPTAPPAAWIAH